MANDELPIWRKHMVVFVVSWMALMATFSITSLLTAIPEIASELSTTIEILNVTNAATLIAMGVSSLIWSPLSEVFGRRLIYNIAISVMVASSIGVAVAPTMALFTALRLICGFTGTFFMVSGQIIITDIFEPAVRGRATACLMIGSVAGPALGPCAGGLIVTYSDWRVIFWLQAAMAGLGLILSLIFVPTIHRRVDSDLSANCKTTQDRQPVHQSPRLALSLAKFNPVRVLKQLNHPEILLAGITCGFLSATQYTLLTSVRHVINPRFHLTTPLVSGLFYISPGLGLVLGSILGGKMSDAAVKSYVQKKGTRRPKDRLNSGLLGLFIILPAALLIYAWPLQMERGGLALPMIAAFWIGIGLMGTFNGINTYMSEVRPAEKTEVVAAKYIMQYAFGAISTAIIVPLIDSVGVGWAFTLWTFLDILGGIFILFIARFSPDSWI
ncbi:hypothetical protein N0V93_002528 [Gnomoniopsis smithogilvyi]|uniref:Major facilitator superfamily (MFS) profile domain-containing protein n=1 Tax=Gnomoniopsis smithogilvyi TaxID=1191159 RepID=A0A9W8YYZ4_9PEZI|nr:hypothetical protein N0V93_002528 [Gnomoniopsis smithogilvyi]